jgi:putative transposase
MTTVQPVRPPPVRAFRARIAPLLPSSVGRPGRRFQDDRRVVEGIIYRFRCGLVCRSTKIHQLVDGHGRLLVVLIGPGQAGNAPMFPHVMAQLRIARRGSGRPRTRPESLRGQGLFVADDRPPLARTPHRRGHPRAGDQQAHKRRGSRGGRPVSYDRADNRNVVDRGFCQSNTASASCAARQAWPGKIRAAS